MPILRYEDWAEASFYSQRLAIQELLLTLLLRGYVPIEFPRDELEKDLERLWETDVWHHYTRAGVFYISGVTSRLPAGRKIIEQFTSWTEGELESAKVLWHRPRPLFVAVKRVLKHKTDVTRHSIINAACKAYRSRFYSRALSPDIYRAIFKRFEIRNQIIADPYPGFGAKAIAALMEENYYHSPADFSELGSFLGTSFGKLDRDHYDVVLLDYNWSFPDDSVIGDLKYWAPRADMKLVYVPSGVTSLPNPTFRVKVELHPLKPGKMGYIYCYF